MVKHQPQQNHYNNLFDLTDKVSVVTGAGHLGSEISKALADFGSKVFVVTRNPDKYKSLSKYNNITLKSCDVTDKDSFLLTLREVGDVDVLVNNAFSENRKDVLDVTKDVWDSGMESMLSHP